VDAADWDERYAAADLVWSAEPNRTLVAEVGESRHGRALDLAAGEGRNALWLAERGWQVTAVDFSPVAVARGRQLAAARGVDITWEVHDVTAWHPPDAGFDLVIVLYLHLPPTQRRIAHRKAAAAVAEGGALIVLGHARDNLQHGVGGPQDPTILLAAREVVDDLEGTGIDVIRAEQVLRPVPGDTSDRIAIDCLVRGSRSSSPPGG
jgi:SAM-dependent methyltransferase